MPTPFQPKISPEASSRLLSIMLAVSEAFPVNDRVRLEWDTELACWQISAFADGKPHGIWTWVINVAPQVLYSDDRVGRAFSSGPPRLSAGPSTRWNRGRS